MGPRRYCVTGRPSWTVVSALFIALGADEAEWPGLADRMARRTVAESPFEVLADCRAVLADYRREQADEPSVFDVVPELGVLGLRRMTAGTLGAGERQLGARETSVSAEVA
jgi:hypothetical protein